MPHNCDLHSIAGKRMLLLFLLECAQFSETGGRAVVRRGKSTEVGIYTSNAARTGDTTLRARMGGLESVAAALQNKVVWYVVGWLAMAVRVGK